MPPKRKAPAAAAKPAAKKPAKAGKMDAPLAGKVFAITGTLKKKRADVEVAIKKAGGSNKASVTVSFDSDL